jgi:hypothetical protein
VRAEDEISFEPLDPAWITLARNQSDRNAALGIDAPGVTDGGKNRAKLNGDPRQCVGVDCKVPGGKHASKKGKGRGDARSALRAAASAGDPLASWLAGLPRH